MLPQDTDGTWDATYGSEKKYASQNVRIGLKKQKRSCGVSEKEIIKIAQKTMGLDEIEKFNPFEKIIEYQIEDTKKTLCKLSLTNFLPAIFLKFEN